MLYIAKKPRFWNKTKSIWLQYSTGGRCNWRFCEGDEWKRGIKSVWKTYLLNSLFHQYQGVCEINTVYACVTNTPTHEGLLGLQWWSGSLTRLTAYPMAWGDAHAFCHWFAMTWIFKGRRIITDILLTIFYSLVVLPNLGLGYPTHLNPWTESSLVPIYWLTTFCRNHHWYIFGLNIT